MTNPKSPVSSSKGRFSKPKTVGGNSRLNKFFVDSLIHIYQVEKSIGKPLKKILGSITNEKLGELISEMIDQSLLHIVRIEDVFEIIGAKAQAGTRAGMDGLIKEIETVAKATQQGSLTRDFAMVTGMQKIIHYRMAAYGGLISLARTMGHDDIAYILYTTLEEQKEADATLCTMAENDLRQALIEQDAAEKDG